MNNRRRTLNDNTKKLLLVRVVQEKPIYWGKSCNTNNYCKSIVKKPVCLLCPALIC